MSEQIAKSEQVATPSSAHELRNMTEVRVTYTQKESLNTPGQDPKLTARNGTVESVDSSDEDERLIAVRQSNGRKILLQTFPDLRENGAYGHVFSVWEDGSQNSLGPIDEIEVR